MAPIVQPTQEYGYLALRDDDDPGFVKVAANIVDAMDPRESVEHLYLVRVENWFDHKWLRFSGKGRVPFQGFERDDPGVALDEFSQDKLTFPPFTPRRIVSNRLLRLSADVPEPSRRLHRRVLRHSAENLHERVEDFSHSLVACWVSTESKTNGRASIMVYRHLSGVLDAWYASFRRDGSEWKLDRVKGVDRESVLRWMELPSD